MAKTKSSYVCQVCGTVHGRWEGRCTGCGAWDTLVEEREEVIPKGLKPSGKPSALPEVTALHALAEPPQRISTGNAECDRALGGGCVPGAAILIGGDPGIGKSTLLLQISAALSTQMEVLYISGEESISQVQLRAARLGLSQADVKLASATSVRDITGLLKKLPSPAFVVIDSIQTMYVDTIESAPGTVSQVRSSAAELVRLCKQRNITLVLVGHVTKEGQIAGPRVLEHMVDTVLYFEGERSHLYRLLRAVKNRFGAAGEIGVFSMGEKGLEEVANPSSLFLSSRDVQVSGAAIYAGMEGSRPVLLEIEALAAVSHYATPRRAVVGWDAARLAMLLAVLEARADMVLADKEVYLNVAGGYRIQDPSADLAAAAALMSAKLDIALPEGTVFYGELGLSGEVRPVSQQPARLREAEKLGFTRAVIPKMEPMPESGLTLIPVAHIRDVMAWVNEL